MIIYAPAKVNLYLKVLGKRKDGYHNIETVFERIALFDKMALRTFKDDKVRIFSDHPDVRRKAGLIYRTISLLKKELRISRGIEVKIFKKIPIASGLGGGSSDAASILVALNKLWKLSLDMTDLFEFGKRLGADVPFFLSGSSFAIGEGKGDEVIPLGWKAKFWHLLISPPLRLLSKDIYSMVQQKRRGKRGQRPFSLLNIRENGRCPLFFKNDLEYTIVKKAPLIARLKNALEDVGFSRLSLVSGSGPSVFNLFEKRKEAVRAKELLIKRFPIVRDKGWQIFIVPTL